MIQVVALIYRNLWKPICRPVKVMELDFYDVNDNMQPHSEQFSVRATDDCMVCNAMAFWFDLHLDEATTLSCSPYADKVGGMRATINQCGQH